MNTIEELAAWFQKNKIECRIYCWNSNSWKWSVHCEKSDDGIKLEVITNGNTLFDALYDAHEKFHLTSSRGASNLLAPQIEYKSSEADGENFYKKSLDDDIPF